MAKCFIEYVAIHGRSVIEHLPHHLMVKGLSPGAATGNGRGTGKKGFTEYVLIGIIAVVEHLPLHLAAKGLSPAVTTGNRGGIGKMFSE